MHPSNNRIIALKSLKYKKFTKNCHKSQSTTHKKPSPTFFDSSYQQYLRQNHGLIQLDTTQTQSALSNLQPHPVIGANTNFNTVEDVLHNNNTGYNEDIINSRNNVIVSQNNNNNNNNNNNSYTINPYAHHDITINQTLSKRYYSNITNQQQTTNEQIYIQQNNNTIATKDTIHGDTNENIWGEDTEIDLNPKEYLRVHIEQINKCYSLKQYSRINALYQSLKRNNIVVPLDTYEKILESFAKRTFDINNKNLDEKMFSLLNCYHDIINNKLKPTTTIYNIVLLQIFKNSIVAFESNNPNGLDFFKIGSELLHTVLKNNTLSKEVINYYLLALNVFSGSPFKYFNINQQDNRNNLIPNLKYFKSTIIDASSLYIKDSFYFIALINLGKLTNDLSFLKDLYHEFLLLLPIESSLSLKENQFEIYSMFITGFLESGEVKLSNKIFENLINEIKLRDGMSKNIQLILSNYLISLSKMDAAKAYSLWSSFKKLNWVPEFTYDFYLQLLANSFHDWNLTKKIYEYIYPMERIFYNKSRITNTSGESNLSSYLLYPIHTEMILNSFMNYALQLNDQDTIFKLLEESMIKSFTFDINLYPGIFKFLTSMNCSTPYLLRIIETQGNLLKDESFTKQNSINNLKYLTAITDATRNDEILNSILRMDFFNDFTKNIEFTGDNINNFNILYNGLIIFLNNLWNSPKTIETYPRYLEIQSSLIIRLFDFDTYVPTEENKLNNTSEFNNFKLGLVERFEKMATNYQRLNIDPNNVHHVVSQAVRLSNLPEETIEYFNNPGDWDKSYPLSLGSQIRNAPATGIKEFENLAHDGYCFDYDTYKELITHKYIRQDIIEKCYEFISAGDIDELRFLTNLIVSKVDPAQLEQLLFLSSSGSNTSISIEKKFFFQKFMLNYLKDKSLSKIITSLHRIKVTPQFLTTLKFPDNFRSITIQAEFKESIDLIYEKLFQAREFTTIVKYNDICPVLSLNILLKSAIRSGETETFGKLFNQFKSSLSHDKAMEIECEHMLDHLRIDETIALCDIYKDDISCPKANDYYTFAMFLKSFTKQASDVVTQPENTLQFSNQLSSFSNFTDVIQYYTHHSNVYKESLSNSKRVEVNKIVLDQMLNNLVDASNIFFENHNVPESTLGKTEIVKQFQLKLKTFYRFKSYLKLQNYKVSELQRLINVWSKVEPFSIDSFFNNVVETIYLNPDSKKNTVALKHDLLWNFNKSSLKLIASDIISAYQLVGDQRKLDKAEQFKSFLEQESIQLA
ncbi:RNase P subunit [Maudiozyma exigua]|uniref:RNase P subunit n=1 Tax=Maudiozyma exigua TaxID=34358 RepID=A0A9P6WEH3_MAUEX|nr:RNase P subunit [Kazachstania exigua]